MRGDTSRLALAWLTICVLTTVLAVGAYIVGQQMGRRGADDVPKVLAQRAAEQLAAAKEPAQVVRSVVRDLSADSSPFLIVFDPDHHLLASSVTVAGAPPQGGALGVWTPQSCRVSIG